MFKNKKHFFTCMHLANSSTNIILRTCNSKFKHYELRAVTEKKTEKNVTEKLKQIKTISGENLRSYLHSNHTGS